MARCDGVSHTQEVFVLKKETGGGTRGFVEAPISTGGMLLKLFLPPAGCILLVRDSY